MESDLVGCWVRNKIAGWTGMVVASLDHCWKPNYLVRRKRRTGLFSVKVTEEYCYTCELEKIDE